MIAGAREVGHADRRATPPKTSERGRNVHSIKTRIVATIGPASRSPEILRRFADEGVDVIRFNLSHGSRDEHNAALRTVRQTPGPGDLPLATLADLCGPKIRVTQIDDAHRKIEVGETCEIVRVLENGTAQRFGTNTPAIVDEVEVGHRVLIDDGAVRLRVIEKTADALRCRCDAGGEIASRKGVNLPDTDLSMPSLTEKDHDDLRWAVASRFAFIALSFVRRADDIHELRHAIEQAGGDQPIVAKVETPQAIHALDDIIEAADVILVARGDLGVELDVWRVPLLQKDMVTRCRRAGKPVIIATQMLHSMVQSPSPTRAEVSDVANAVLDGADALMLSGETAVGKYPVQAVEMLNRVAAEAEAHRGVVVGHGDILDPELRVGHRTDSVTSAVARSAALVAHDAQARLIAVWCRTGRTARWLSKYQLPQSIVGLAGSESVCHELALSYGVEPIRIDPDRVRADDWWPGLCALLASRYILAPGDPVVVVGDPRRPSARSSISLHVV